MPDQPVFHIARDIVDGAQIVEISTPSVADPKVASELKEQLFSLLQPDDPKNFVLDFKYVRMFSSTAFGAVMAFVLEVRKRGGQVRTCSMDEFVRFGADVIRMGDYAEFHDDLTGALDSIRSA
jgi:anti-anti-sigma factor